MLIGAERYVIVIVQMTPVLSRNWMIHYCTIPKTKEVQAYDPLVILLKVIDVHFNVLFVRALSLVVGYTRAIPVDNDSTGTYRYVPYTITKRRDDKNNDER